MKSTRQRLLCRIVQSCHITNHAGSGVCITDNGLVMGSQAGLVGLDNGLQRFDASRNSRLGTCLYYSIRAEVAKEFRQQNRVVALPRSAQEEVVRMDKAVAAFAREHDR